MIDCSPHTPPTRQFSSIHRPGLKRAVLACLYAIFQLFATSARAGVHVAEGVAYLFDESTARLDRYDLKSQQWLESKTVKVGMEPHAIAFNSGHLFVSGGTAISRFDLDGSNPMSLEEVTTPTVELLADQDFIFAFGSGSFRQTVTSLNSETGQVIDTYMSNSSINRPAFDPAARLIVGQRSTSSFIGITYHPDGTFTDFNHESDASQGWRNTTTALPGSSGFIADNGDLFASSHRLKKLGNLGASYESIAFLKGGGLVTLEGQKLTGYDATFRQTGTMTVEDGEWELASHHREVFLLRATSDSRAARRLDLTLLDLGTEGEAKDPRGTKFDPDAVFVDRDGVVNLVSRLHRAVFRWSQETGKFLPAIALSHDPEMVAYSPESQRLFTGVRTGTVFAIDFTVAEPREEIFVEGLNVLEGLGAAGSMVFMHAFRLGNPSFLEFQTYDQEGQLLFRLRNVARELADEFVWNAASRKLFAISSSFSNQDIRSLTIDEQGRISQGYENPRLEIEGFEVQAPIRPNPSGDLVVEGTGNIIQADQPLFLGALPVSPADMVWLDDSRLVALVKEGTGTVVSSFNEMIPLDVGETVLPGTPVRALKSGEFLMVVTSEDSYPIFSLLDPDTLELIETSTRQPAAPVLALGAVTSDEIEVLWEVPATEADSVEVQFRVRYTSAWEFGGVAPAAAGLLTISGLTERETYEVRAFAEEGFYRSMPSGTHRETTAFDPESLVGGPYDLEVVALTASEISLAWLDQSGGEEGYYLYRIEGEDQDLAEGLRIELPANTTSYVDRGLETGKNYGYAIQTFRGGEVTEPSEVVFAVTDGDSPPSGLGFISEAKEFRNRLEFRWKALARTEDGFAIFRATSPAFRAAVEVARVGRNVDSFVDDQVTGGTQYWYWVYPFNSNGWAEGTRISTRGLYVWRESYGRFQDVHFRHGDIEYFVLSAPDRIERYDLASRSWLDDIPLNESARSLWVDESGIYAALSRQVVRLAEDGSVESVFGIPGRISGFAPLRDRYWLVFYSLGSGIANDSYELVLDRESLQVVSHRSSPGAFTNLQLSNDKKAVFFEYKISTHKRFYGEDGKYDFRRSHEVRNYGRSWLFPDRNQLVMGTSIPVIRNTRDLSSAGVVSRQCSWRSLADVDFFRGIPILLTGCGLEAVNRNLEVSGLIRLEEGPSFVGVSGETVTTFEEDYYAPHGFRTEEYPILDLNPELFDRADDPKGLAYLPDGQFVDHEGVLHLLHALEKKIYRWSVSEKSYLSPINLRDSPSSMDFIDGGDAIYLEYPSGRVTLIDLSSEVLEEIDILRPSDAVVEQEVAGDFLVVISGSWEDRVMSCYDRAGELVDEISTSPLEGLTWDGDRGRLLYFTLGEQPDSYRMNARVLSGEGTFGEEIPLYEANDFFEEFLPSPAGVQAIADSLVFGFDDSGRRVVLETMPEVIQSVIWSGEDEVLAAVGLEDLTQIRRFSSRDGSLRGHIQIEGEPLKIHRVGEDLLAVTLVDGRPALTLLGENLEIIFVTPDYPPVPDGLRVTGQTTNGISLAWNDRSDAGTSYRIEGRVLGSVDWKIVGRTAGSSGTFTVTSLATATPLEFRVSAENSFHLSRPSEAVEGETLPPEFRLAIDRLLPLPDGSMIIEFGTIPGETYFVEYSSDMVTWHRSPVQIAAETARDRWHDEGPPKTTCHPRDCPGRFYRLVEPSNAGN